MAAFLSELLLVLRRLAHWWLGELAGLAPAWLRRRFTAPKDRLVLLPGEADVMVALEAGDELRPLGRVDPRVTPDARQALLMLLRRHGLAEADGQGKFATCVRLGAVRALRTTIDLPLAAEANLREVVSFELDRHTPFRAEQALFAFRILERDAAAQRLHIELTVVPRAIAEEAGAIAARFGRTADRIDVAEEAGYRTISENLLPNNAMLSRQPASRRLIYGVGAVAVILAVIAVYLPIERAQHAAAALSAQFAAIKNSVASAAALRKEIDELDKDERFLIDRKRGTPSASRLLFETTHILPDDTWLSDWQFSGSEIQIQGFTRSASAVVGLLEDSRVFRGTTYRSPVTQDRLAGRERFHIAAQAVTGTAP
jgi:general secretion pathway protein L